MEKRDANRASAASRLFRVCAGLPVRQKPCDCVVYKGAVRCAVEVQREMAEINADVPPGRRIEFRMGINVGDIIRDGRDIYALSTRQDTCCRLGSSTSPKL